MRRSNAESHSSSDNQPSLCLFLVDVIFICFGVFVVIPFIANQLPDSSYIDDILTTEKNRPADNSTKNIMIGDIPIDNISNIRFITTPIKSNVYSLTFEVETIPPTD